MSVVSVATACFMAVLAQNAPSSEIRLTPPEIKWPSSGPVTLKGDPTKPGLYTIRFRIPPNTRAMPHAHQDDRSATILSGTWYFGYGKTFNEAALKALPPGSFYTEPPGTYHFSMTKEDEVVIEVSGYGPSSTTQADPQREPGRQ